MYIWSLSPFLAELVNPWDFLSGEGDEGVFCYANEATLGTFLFT